MKNKALILAALAAAAFYLWKKKNPDFRAQPGLPQSEATIPGTSQDMFIAAQNQGLLGLGMSESGTNVIMLPVNKEPDSVQLVRKVKGDVAPHSYQQLTDNSLYGYLADPND